MLNFCFGVFALAAIELLVFLACAATKRYAVERERAKQEVELARIRSTSELELTKLRDREAAREQKNEADRRRYAENPQVPLRDKARKIIRSVISKEADLNSEYGVSLADIIIGIRNQFDPAMNFCNYGAVWELDHDRPLSSFDLTDAAQFALAISPDNLQPLFKGENRQKSDRVFPSLVAVG